MCAFSCLLPDGDNAWSSIFQESWNDPLERDRSSSFDSYPTPTASGNGGHSYQKLNHNVSERHRRKKINSLYSSLRSLLPLADQSIRKLSIPNTVDKVVKYIPELQNEVERLVRKREELSSRVAEDETRRPKRTCNRRIITNDLPAVSATRLGDDQIAVQICGRQNTSDPEGSAFSYLLDRMEEDGFSLLNLSSLNSSPETVFYHLHFLEVKKGRSGDVEQEDLCRKLLSLYERGEKLGRKQICS